METLCAVLLQLYISLLEAVESIVVTGVWKVAHAVQGFSLNSQAKVPFRAEQSSCVFVQSSILGNLRGVSSHNSLRGLAGSARARYVFIVFRVVYVLGPFADRVENV